MNIGIIGAGITGLAAAYDLTKHGHTVTVYEARPYAGGLAAGFYDARWEWHLDRFYHHWFASDDNVIGLIEELGARDRLFSPAPPLPSTTRTGSIRWIVPCPRSNSSLWRRCTAPSACFSLHHCRW